MAAGSAFSAPPPGGGGGGWNIAYQWSGTVVDGNTTTQVSTASNCFGVSAINDLVDWSGSVNCTVTVTVTYSGPPLDPNSPYYLKTVSDTSATAGGASPWVAATDAFGQSQASSGSSSESIACDGEGLQLIKLNASNQMQITLQASASASSLLPPATWGVQAGYTCSVTQRGLVVGPAPASAPTYCRGAEGVKVQNVADPNTGEWRMDLGPAREDWDTDSSGTALYYLDWAWQVLGSTVGEGWIYPLTSISWSAPDPATFTYSLNTGNTTNTFAIDNDHGPRQQPDVGLAQAELPWYGYAGGEGPRRTTLTVTDSLGSESKSLVYYVHGPLEDTGTTWEANYPQSGSPAGLDKCPNATVAGNFPHIYLYAQSNDTYSDQDVVFTISQSHSYTDGCETTFGGESGISLGGMLNIKYNSGFTSKSSSQFAIGEVISGQFTVEPGDTVTVYMEAFGNAWFPTGSQWGPAGYTGDVDIIMVKMSGWGLDYVEVPTPG